MSSRLVNNKIHGVTPTNRMKCIHYSQLPQHKTITLVSFVYYNYKPSISEKWSVRRIVGGDKRVYNKDSESPTITLIATNIIINSITYDSTKETRLALCAAKDFFLTAPTNTLEYIKIHVKHLPQDIIGAYNLQQYIHNDCVDYEINKRMCGVK